MIGPEMIQDLRALAGLPRLQQPELIRDWMMHTLYSSSKDGPNNGPLWTTGGEILDDLIRKNDGVIEHLQKSRLVRNSAKAPAPTLVRQTAFDGDLGPDTTGPLVRQNAYNGRHVTFQDARNEVLIIPDVKATVDEKIMRRELEVNAIIQSDLEERTKMECP